MEPTSLFPPLNVEFKKINFLAGVYVVKEYSLKVSASYDGSLSWALNKN